jgi:TonB family protein
MNAIEIWVFGYLVNAAWQVPLVFAVAWCVARAWRRMGAEFVHRVWVVALLIQVALPACALPVVAMARLLRAWWLSATSHTVAYAGGVVVTTGAGMVQGGLVLAPWLLHGSVALFATYGLCFAVRLGVGVWRTMGLRRRACGLVLQDAVRRAFARFERVFGVPNAPVMMSREIAGPVTVGVRRRVLLLPEGWETGILEEDLDAVLAHEFAHMRRRDFAKNLLYEVLSLPVAWHPMVWVTRRRVAESREIVCDAMAAEAVRGRQRYARSLLRLAAQFSQTRRATRVHAIGIFDANHFGNFERRVMRLTEKRVEMRGVRRVMTVALGLALAAVACGSAMALRTHVAVPQTATQQQTAAMPQSFVLATPRPSNGRPAQSFKAEVKPEDIAAASTGDTPAPTRLKVLTPPYDESDQTPKAPSATEVSAGAMAGNILTKVTPVYPQAAKDAKIQGAVVLDAVIGKDGLIKSLKLVSGPEELTHSAWNAVSQWTYKPYLLNGEPTEVETTITVNYSLAQ